jgi:D-glycero-D-manno-heptose 1,7-bisphosphate phosphatase
MCGPPLSRGRGNSLGEKLPEPKRRAVFLDRDGTICEEMGYMNHVTRLLVYPFAAAAIRKLNDARIPVVVVTNQSGVSRKFFPESLVREVHDKMTQILKQGGAHLDGIYFCPHQRSDNCECRKPLAGLLNSAAHDLHLNLNGSYVVGDRYADVEMAHRAGSKGVLVMTGYGRGDYELHRDEWPRKPDTVQENLRDSVEWILAQESMISSPAYRTRDLS